MLLDQRALECELVWNLPPGSPSWAGQQWQKQGSWQNLPLEISVECGRSEVASKPHPKRSLIRLGAPSWGTPTNQSSSPSPSGWSAVAVGPEQSQLQVAGVSWSQWQGTSPYLANSFIQDKSGPEDAR